MVQRRGLINLKQQLLWYMFDSLGKNFLELKTAFLAFDQSMM